MRIIRGKYKTRRLPNPKGFSARPTTDFAKENLFNVIDNRYYFDNKSVLDLFSGTGSIAYEFASRGCSQVITVEKNFKHFQFVSQVVNKLGIEEVHPIKADVFKFLESCTAQFEFIFADPPYKLENIDKIPNLIFERGLLKPDGLFILEHPSNHAFNTHPNFNEHREYGSVNFSFFSL